MQASKTSSSIQDPSEHVSLPPVELITLGQTEIDVDEPTFLDVVTDYPEATFQRDDLPVVSEVPADKPVQVVAREDIAEIRPEPARPPPDWCVDQNGDIIAMTTFELWLALARGDFDAKTRVWNLNMDNWEHVRDVPELAHALNDSLSLVPPPVLPTPTPFLSVRGHERTPLGFGTTDSANDDAPAQSGRVSRWGRLSFGRWGAVVGGVAAVAAAALLTIVPQRLETQALAVAAMPAATAQLYSAMERANRQVEEATHRRLEKEAARVVEPVSSSSRRHKEAGQFRFRRGRR